MLRDLAKVAVIAFAVSFVVGLVAALAGYPITPELIASWLAQGLGYVRL